MAKHFNPEDVPKLVDQWYSGVRAVSKVAEMRLMIGNVRIGYDG